MKPYIYMTVLGFNTTGAGGRSPIYVVVGHPDPEWEPSLVGFRPHTHSYLPRRHD